MVGQNRRRRSFGGEVKARDIKTDNITLVRVRKDDVSHPVVSPGDMGERII